MSYINWLVATVSDHYFMIIIIIMPIFVDVVIDHIADSKLFAGCWN